MRESHQKSEVHITVVKKSHQHHVVTINDGSISFVNLYETQTDESLLNKHDVFNPNFRTDFHENRPRILMKPTQLPFLVEFLAQSYSLSWSSRYR